MYHYCCMSSGLWWVGILDGSGTRSPQVSWHRCADSHVPPQHTYPQLQSENMKRNTTGIYSWVCTIKPVNRLGVFFGYLREAEKIWHITHQFFSCYCELVGQKSPIYTSNRHRSTLLFIWNQVCVHLMNVSKKFHLLLTLFRPLGIPESNVWLFRI